MLCYKAIYAFNQYAINRFRLYFVWKGNYDNIVFQFQIHSERLLAIFS